MSGRDPDREAKELEAERALAQPRADFLLTLADRADAEKAELAKMHAGAVESARAMIRRGELLEAASVFDAIADTYRGRCFIADADHYAQRAKDARAAHRLKKRNAKKGPRP
jgi:hypothetical protein